MLWVALLRIGSKTWQTRCDAARALAISRSPRATQALLRCFHDAEAAVRQRALVAMDPGADEPEIAMRAVVRSEDPQVRDALMRVLVTDQVASLRREAARVLVASAGSDGPARDHLVERLLDAIRSELDPDVRVATARQASRLCSQLTPPVRARVADATMVLLDRDATVEAGCCLLSALKDRRATEVLERIVKTADAHTDSHWAALSAMAEIAPERLKQPLRDPQVVAALRSINVPKEPRMRDWPTLGQAMATLSDRASMSFGVAPIPDEINSAIDRMVTYAFSGTAESEASNNNVLVYGGIDGGHLSGDRSLRELRGAIVKAVWRFPSPERSAFVRAQGYRQ